MFTPSHSISLFRASCMQFLQYQQVWNSKFVAQLGFVFFLLTSDGLHACDLIRDDRLFPVPSVYEQQLARSLSSMPCLASNATLETGASLLPNCHIGTFDVARGVGAEAMSMTLEKRC